MDGIDSLVNEALDDANGKGEADFIAGADLEELPDPDQFSEFMIGKTSFMIGITWFMIVRTIFMISM